MRKFSYLLFVFLILQLPGIAQPLVGLNKAEIIKYMKQCEPDFALDNEMVNTKYNYLKYYDNANEETILCFLTDKDVCTLVRKMSDYSNLDLTIKKMDNDYKKIGKDVWAYTKDNKEFIVDLKREKWYFTLETRRKK